MKTAAGPQKARLAAASTASAAAPLPPLPAAAASLPRGRGGARAGSLPKLLDASGEEEERKEPRVGTASLAGSPER